MVEIYNRLTINFEGNEYRYTLNIRDEGLVNLLSITNMFNIDVRKALVLIESKRGHVNKFSGVIFFRSRKKAREFGDLIEEQYNENKLHSVFSV